MNSSPKAQPKHLINWLSNAVGNVFDPVPLHQMPIEEQIFAALLREDKSFFESQNIVFSDHWTGVIALAEQQQMASLMVTVMVDLGLAEILLGNKYSLAELKRIATREIINSDCISDRHVEILRKLGPLADQVVFIKGTALAHSVYRNKSMRSHCDLDIVVPEKKFIEVCRVLETSGFQPLTMDAGFCNQKGVGPTQTFADLLLRPANGWTPPAILTFNKPDWPQADLKLSPFDIGMQMAGLEQFFSDSQRIVTNTCSFNVPSFHVQLAVSLYHLNKAHFDSWKYLLDVHLLANKMEAEWDDFVITCSEEGLRPLAHAGLMLVIDRLHTAVPESVIRSLRSQSKTSETPVLIIKPSFAWNLNSLPMLMINASTSSDGQRKWNLLLQSLRPSRTFLFTYYFPRNATSRSSLFYPFLLLLHWLTLLLPGGLVRKTYGSLLWK